MIPHISLPLLELLERYFDWGETYAEGVRLLLGARGYVRAPRGRLLDRGVVQRARVDRLRQARRRDQVRLPADRPVEVDLARIRARRPRTDGGALGHAPTRGCARHDLDGELAHLARIDLDHDRRWVLHLDALVGRLGGDVQPDRGARERAGGVDAGEEIARVHVLDHIGEARVGDIG